MDLLISVVVHIHHCLLLLIKGSVRRDVDGVETTSKGRATASQDACRWVGYRVADNHTFHQSNSSGKDVMGDFSAGNSSGFLFCTSAGKTAK